MDLWTLARSRLFGIASLDYRLVGRWLLWLPRGRLRHHSIASSPPMPGERWIGWTAHYLIGIAFAATHAVFGLGLYVAGWAVLGLNALFNRLS